MSNELIEITEQLLTSIATADWATYEKLCDPSITAFEPEACGYLVEGMDFHKFYFDLGSSDKARQTSMLNPHVRMLGEDVAIICYTRLVQTLDASNSPVSATCEETRVWHRQDGEWKHVHFHRSPNE